MTYQTEPQIEIYRGESLTLHGRIPFLPVVRESLQRLLGRKLNDARLQVILLNVPEYSVSVGLPVVENGVPDFGYAYVKVFVGGYLLYQHPHPLRDILTETLQIALRDACPEEMLWTFRIDVPGMPRASVVRPTPVIQGETTVRPYGPGEGPPFAFRRIEEEEPPLRSLEDFGLSPDIGPGLASLTVLVDDSVRREMLETCPLSNEVEEGGFLLGRAYRDASREGNYLLELLAAPLAEHTGASFLHFTFTGDSFAEVKRTLRQQRPGERLLGWYHTHLFPATPDFGLSSVDLVLHFGNFTIPWQVAGLINLEGTGRVLRFYVREGGTMVECPWYTIHERD